MPSGITLAQAEIPLASSQSETGQAPVAPSVMQLPGPHDVSGQPNELGVWWARRWLQFQGSWLRGYGGIYQYMEDLLALDHCRATPDTWHVPLQNGSYIVTPLGWVEWDEVLNHQPDQQFIAYIVSGLRQDQPFWRNTKRVDRELFSLKYATVDRAAESVVQLGRGALMAKIDIKAAYRLIPVHPADRWLLGMQFEGAIFMDTVLPFGSRYAPKIFNAVANALEWACRNNGVGNMLHYLDDFMVFGAPDSSECADYLMIVPTARQYSIPPQLESVLVTVQPDWMSVNCSAIVFSWNSAVHQEDLQIFLGGKDPDIGSMPYLEYVLKGFCKLAAGKSRPRLPITPSILSKMRETWSKIPKRKNAAMLWAASCMCFFGFLHSGEIVVPSDTSYDPAVHLSYGDVRTDSIENPTCITVAVKASITDPFRKGVVIHIGATKTQLCPVAQSWVT
eukprot:Em0003g1137a